MDWNIQSRARACQECGQHFTDKQPYHTLLTAGKEGYERLDACAPCWNTKHAPGLKERAGVVSYWQGVFLAPPPAPPEAIQKATAETLLRQLVEKGDPRHGAACYILAVMLERKRLLKVQKQVRDGGRRIFIYEQPKTGDVFTILDPDLQLDQLEEVQRDVAALLEKGVEGALEAQQPSETAAAPMETATPAVHEAIPGTLETEQAKALAENAAV